MVQRYAHFDQKQLKRFGENQNHGTNTVQAKPKIV